jgi:hypothetical protein
MKKILKRRNMAITFNKKEKINSFSFEQNGVKIDKIKISSKMIDLKNEQSEKVNKMLMGKIKKNGMKINPNSKGEIDIKDFNLSEEDFLKMTNKDNNYFEEMTSLVFEQQNSDIEELKSIFLEMDKKNDTKLSNSLYTSFVGNITNKVEEEINKIMGENTPS